MGSYNPTFDIPPLEEVESSVTHIFKWEDYQVRVEAITGMTEVNVGWTRRPERIVAFKGILYEEDETVLSEHEMFHIDVTLRPLPWWMNVLARLGNEEEPGSVEEFFYDFIFNLGYKSEKAIPPDDVHTEFEQLADKLIEAGAFAKSKKERESSWKPYCEIYADEFIEWNV